ncbi:hypothetical protein B0H67DRAFT_639219 [Lasiosphaeris hirsuta]|uniref:DUF7905 domain-containing protein n=1 Tax=Lasiosphaeris hirsuta TaxID=260670 RepID=A0AA40BAL9_9PEZI|nr:hypothetical protein B0H67DRAFT_639219 [Lasiosphaeris hirsuta]
MDSSRRTGKPPVGEKPKKPVYDFKLHLTLPSVGYGYTGLDPSDIDTRTLLSQIEEELGVHIHNDVAGVSLTVMAPDKLKAKQARELIEKILRRKPGEANIWRSWALLNAPKDKNQPMIITLQKVEGGRRPIATPEPQPTTDGDCDGDSISRTASITWQYKERLKEILTATVDNLRNIPNKMRMRVQFGSLQLQQWKKGKVNYTLSEIESFADRLAFRGVCGFESLIGGEKTANRLRALLSDADDITPWAPGVGNTKEIKTNCSIILVTKNLSIESAIEAVRAKGTVRGTFVGPIAYSFGPLQAFHREKSMRAVEIMTSCPENRYDWEIEIQSHIGATGIPFRHTDLKNNTIFTGKDQAEGFPGFKLSEHFINSHEIEQVIGKSSWTYMPRSKPYKIEVSMLHVWETTNTTLKPITGAGLTMYGDDWDYDMELKDLTSGSRDWETFSRFLDAHHGLGDGMDEYDDFLACIHRLLELLDETG